MTAKTLQISTISIAVALAGVMVWAIITDNFIVPMVAVILAVGLSYLLRRKAKVVTRDERSTVLYEKAAGSTIKLCIPLAALAGIGILIFQERLSAELVTTGQILAYFACILMLVQLAFYAYYSRKY
jgi:uncharacterized membrane protein